MASTNDAEPFFLQDSLSLIRMVVADQAGTCVGVLPITQEYDTRSTNLLCLLKGYPPVEIKATTQRSVKFCINDLSALTNDVHSNEHSYRC